MAGDRYHHGHAGYLLADTLYAGLPIWASGSATPALVLNCYAWLDRRPAPRPGRTSIAPSGS
jgi:hypothetical protein